MSENFQLARTPHLHFGAGKIASLSAVLKPYGSKVLLVTGKKSFELSPHSSEVLNQLRENRLFFETCSIDGEPSPAMIDNAVARFSGWAPNVVVAIGGGSVLDGGKAISAMIPLGGNIKNYLEGVGKASHPGDKIPFVAIPTTAGTGSEATKNAVLAETGPNGFKKSLRHDNFVPEIAIVDPALSLSCPQHVSAASGMDAFTQLLESFLSTSANAITDSLAFAGLERIARSLPEVYRDGTNLMARADMAMAAYLSGITLANAGLGAVHGLAGTIGGMYSIPHGVVCSALMPSANQVTLRKLRKNGDTTDALMKYARIGAVFSNEKGKSDDYYADYLVNQIGEWKTAMQIPTLSACGLPSESLREIAKNSNSKNNPITLDSDELEEILLLAM